MVLRLIAILLLCGIVGCAESDFSKVDPNKCCPSSYWPETGYFIHSYKWEYDSAGVATAVCETCGWRYTPKESK